LGLGGSTHGGGASDGHGGHGPFVVDLVSAATGEGVHAAFNRLVVAVQKRQPAHRRPFAGGAVAVTDHGAGRADSGPAARGTGRSKRRAPRRGKGSFADSSGAAGRGRASRAGSGGATSAKPRAAGRLALWAVNKERSGDRLHDDAPNEGALERK
jgi:hypothetical protein